MEIENIKTFLDSANFSNEKLKEIIIKISKLISDEQTKKEITKSKIKTEEQARQILHS